MPTKNTSGLPIDPVKDFEQLIPINEVPDLFPAALKPHKQSVWRWCSRQGGRGGVVLESILLGKQRFTTRACVDRFLRAVATAGARNASVQSKPARKKATRKSRRMKDRARDARRKLRAVNVLKR